MDSLLNDICRVFLRNGSDHPNMTKLLQKLVEQQGLAPKPPQPNAGGQGATARVGIKANKATIETT